MPESAKDADAQPPPSVLRNARILIVDDDERTAMAVRSALEQLGQILVVAHSGEEALHRLLFDDYAVILLDFIIKQKTAYEMATYVRARKRTRHIPIVF